MKEPFEQIEHTADYAILARGQDLRELIENAGRGMISLLVEGESLRPQQQVAFTSTISSRMAWKLMKATAYSPERLLIECLRELLYLSEEGQIPIRFTVQDLDQATLTAHTQAGVVDIADAKDYLLGAVKAVTYHALEIKSGPEGLQVQIVFDT